MSVYIGLIALGLVSLWSGLTGIVLHENCLVNLVVLYSPMSVLDGVSNNLSVYVIGILICKDFVVVVVVSFEMTGSVMCNDCVAVGYDDLLITVVGDNGGIIIQSAVSSSSLSSVEDCDDDDDDTSESSLSLLQLLSGECVGDRDSVLEVVVCDITSLTDEVVRVVASSCCLRSIVILSSRRVRFLFLSRKSTVSFSLCVSCFCVSRSSTRIAVSLSL